MRVLITGAAGFIGFHCAKYLLDTGHSVAGLDNLNSYYSAFLKQARLAILERHDRFRFIKADLQDAGSFHKLWHDFEPDHVLHLAAQVGVREAARDPAAYIFSNIVGFQNVIEMVRTCRPANFVYASSSSVYGINNTPPFHEGQDTRSPASLYAATKQSNELVAHCYAHQFDIQVTGLRFFTVYGPYGRPDMAIFKFTEQLLDDAPIRLHSSAVMTRDFTYIDDIVAGVMAALKRPQTNKVYNLGSARTTRLPVLVETLARMLNVTPRIEHVSMDRAEVENTLADISLAQDELGYSPATTLERGLENFVAWIREWRRLHGNKRVST